MSHPAPLSNALSLMLAPPPEVLGPTLYPTPTSSSAMVGKWSLLPTPLLKQGGRHLPLIPARQAGTRGDRLGQSSHKAVVPRSGA